MLNPSLLFSTPVSIKTKYSFEYHKADLKKEYYSSLFFACQAYV